MHVSSAGETDSCCSEEFVVCCLHVIYRVLETTVGSSELLQPLHGAVVERLTSDWRTAGLIPACE